jgi:uncharacterized membrane protein
MGRRGRAAEVPLRGAARIPATRTASPAPASGASRGAAAPTLAHPVDVGTARWPLLDCARGVAIVAMVVYHACFDLAHFGWLAADFAADWRWLAFRGAILSSFLAIAGMSLGIAAVRGLDRRRFLLRIATIAGAALLVSAGSYAMFPESYIWFGVLHAIAVMSIVTRVLLPLDAWLAPLGVAIIVAGNLVAAPVFDRPLLQWIGMMTFKPHTEDYVPLFPWLGVMLLGAAAGLFVARRRALAMRFATRRTPRAATWLPWLGKHSLVVYLAHQPLLIGVMMLVKRL